MGDQREGFLLFHNHEADKRVRGGTQGGGRSGGNSTLVRGHSKKSEGTRGTALSKTEREASRKKKTSSIERLGEGLREESLTLNSEERGRTGE